MLRDAQILHEGKVMQLLAGMCCAKDTMVQRLLVADVGMASFGSACVMQGRQNASLDMRSMSYSCMKVRDNCMKVMSLSTGVHAFYCDLH